MTVIMINIISAYLSDKKMEHGTMIPESHCFSLPSSMMATIKNSTFKTNVLLVADMHWNGLVGEDACLWVYV